MTKKRNLMSYVCISGVVILFLLEYRYFMNARLSANMRTLNLQTYLLVLCILLVIAGRTIEVRRVTISAGLLCVYMVLVTLFIQNNSQFSAASISKAMLWFAVLVLGIKASTLNISRNTLISIVLVYIVLVEINYWRAMIFDFSNPNKDHVVTSVYYLIVAIPFVLLMENKTLKKTVMAVIIISVVWSFKRSAALVLFVCFIGLFLANWKNLQQKQKKLFFVVSFFALVSIIFLPMLLKNVDSNVLNVWTSRLYSGADSRTDIYSEVLRIFSGSNILNQLFGHGQNATVMYTYSGLSAHNDYIEMLFDYGIVGLMLFMSFLINLYKTYIYITDVDDKHLRDGFVFALGIFIVASIPSHMLTYGTYFLLVILYIGYAIGESNKVYSTMAIEE